MRHDHLIDEIEPRGFDRALLRRLLGYLAPYRGQMAFSILLLFGAALLQLVGPYLVKVGIDKHISAGNMAGLDRVALLFIAAALAGFALRYAQTLLTYRIGQRAMMDLRLAVFDRIEAQSLAYFDRNPTGRLMTRVGSDVEVLQELFSSGAITIFGDLFTVLGVVAAMLAINWRLALVSFAVLPLLFGATILFRSRVRRSFRAIRQKVARMNSYLNEHLSGINVVKLFSRERSAAARFERINDEHRQAFLGAVQAYAIFFPVVEFIGALAMALLLGYGGVQIIGGTLSFGSLVAFLEYVQRFYKPVQDLAEKFNILQSAMAAAERIFAVLDSVPEINDPAAPVAAGRARGVVEFRDVSFSYKPGEEILRNISLKIDPGEMVAIVGATGAGKSSIISLLARLYDPLSGAVLLDGRDVRDYTQDHLHRQMAVVLQDVFLFSGTVLSNISLGNPAITRGAVEEAARRVGADTFIRRLPLGYDTEVGERGALLSVGQKQLLSFARALAHDPPLLVLDEATSSVDSESELLIQEALDVLFAGRTSIVIAHRLSTIRGADRIVALHKGRIRESGTHAELLRLGGIYAKLHRLQYS
jgi:ATP-binding cassette subfamily B protein